jgi:hypothetical protein
MSRRVPFLIVFLILIAQGSKAQEYWVFFKNKSGCTFDPYAYFDPKAIERRIRNEVPICDSTDFPVNENYITVVKSIADTTSYASRWFNALAVTASEDQIHKIAALPFVASIEPMYMEAIPAMVPDDPLTDTGMTVYMKELLEWQTLRMDRPAFENANLDGTGVRIAVFDGGYPALDSSEAFSHLFENKRIIKTWDFVRNKENVYAYNPHGMLVLSCLAGIFNAQKMGFATGSEYLLARTEVAAERYREEKNWLAALEWADKNGADIINSSVGYTYHRYFKEEMDGKTSLVSRAANLAARKGILVVNAIGNEGDEEWQIMCTPADADSVLTVGGIDPITGYHMEISSYGPTADRRMKPNVSAFSDVVAMGPRGVVNVQGTSFSCPLVAGFAACALQAYPNMKTMDLFRLIERSGDLYPYFDYAHGYGVPRATKIVYKEKVPVPTFAFVLSTTAISVVLRDFKYSADERTSQLLMYYNIMDTDGFIEEFHVIIVYQAEALRIPLSRFAPGEKLNVHFRGYTSSWSIKPIE